MANNLYYRHMELEHEALALLLEDGDIVDLSTVQLNTPTVESDERPDETENPYDAPLCQTFVPLNYQRATEQEVVRQSVQQSYPHQTPSSSSRTLPVVMWPQAGDMPVNEFRTEGYMSCAFPTLFPTGAADFTAPREWQVTIGNYFKHLVLYKDRRFAQHPRFRYFALNTEMRWRALQSGRIYVRQHPHDAHLSVEELRDMVGREGEAFSSRVQHFASSLRGTRSYWYRQRSRLISMVDTLGLPTVFFTHSAADLQWPELARLMSPSDPDSITSRRRALAENPAIADWFFHERIHKFIKDFYVGVLRAKDFWMRGNTAGELMSMVWLGYQTHQTLSRHFAHQTLTQKLQTVWCHTSTDLSQPSIRPFLMMAVTKTRLLHHRRTPTSATSHTQKCMTTYSDLVTTCQRHTHCSPAYCLCCFGFPKPLQPLTTLTMEDGEPQVVTARNDRLINSHNPIELYAWRANVDIQYCISRRKVIEYCAKYATKCEFRSQSLQAVYKTIVRDIKEEDTSLKVVQKLLINTAGDRDYSAQETCHLLLQLPMYRASQDFVVLSLDGSRAVQERLQEDESATVPSGVDHYMSRPATPEFESMTLLHFIQQYTLPKNIGAQPIRRSKSVVVIIRPYCPPDPDGSKYEAYCRQKLMLYQSFRQQQTLMAGFDTYTAAYANFLQSGNVPHIYQLEQQAALHTEGDSNDDELNDQSPSRTSEEWMLLCQLNPQILPNDEPFENVNWTDSAQNYPNSRSLPPSSQDTRKLLCRTLSARQLNHSSSKVNNYRPTPQCINIMRRTTHNLFG